MGIVSYINSTAGLLPLGLPCSPTPSSRRLSRLRSLHMTTPYLGRFEAQLLTVLSRLEQLSVSIKDPRDLSLLGSCLPRLLPGFYFLRRIGPCFCRRRSPASRLDLQAPSFSFMLLTQLSLPLLQVLTVACGHQREGVRSLDLFNERLCLRFATGLPRLVTLVHSMPVTPGRRLPPPRPPRAPRAPLRCELVFLFSDSGISSSSASSSSSSCACLRSSHTVTHHLSLIVLLPLHACQGY